MYHSTVGYLILIGQYMFKGVCLFLFNGKHLAINAMNQYATNPTFKTVDVEVYRIIDDMFA